MKESGASPDRAGRIHPFSHAAGRRFDARLMMRQLTM
jgi:hypothetical protein